MGFKKDDLTKEKILEHLKNIIGILVEYLKGTAIDSIIIIVVNLIFMLIMRMPYSVLISIVAGVTNFIPSFGPVLGALFGGVILFFDDPKSAMWFLIFTVVLQVVDGFFIKPKIFGKSFEISGFVMLIVMLIGGGLFGVVGLIICVPVAAIVNYIIKNVYRSQK
ncbi:MAG: AI-2E family transporter [Lachnospiraceae bacterium]|nr:AI-2E family transporter [Lachnospiraceae bacterium]